MSGKRTTLSSMLGQYRGPTPSMRPLYRGERSRLARMTSLAVSYTHLDVYKRQIKSNKTQKRFWVKGKEKRIHSARFIFRTLALFRRV